MVYLSPIKEGGFTIDNISIYLNNILSPTLKKHGISDNFLQYTLDIVEMQMTSLLRHWDNYAFRSTILLLGLEEGSYYEPPCKIDIRCFVVAALRNSPIEVMQSEKYSNSGMHKPLLNCDVKAITSEAIRYFSKQDFSLLCTQAKKHVTEDIYLNLSEKYPISWYALRKLATSSAKSTDYAKLTSIAPYSLKEVNQKEENPDETSADILATTCFDGYSPEFDPNLLSILNQFAVASDGAFIVDSFKSLSRNPEKLFKVMEFLLSRNIPFVTSNFYIENGHVERRMKPLRAGHTFEDMENNLKQYYMLGPRHKEALKHFLDQPAPSNSDS